nr:HAMP domain-containing histidine kinase [Bacillota bacterium]
IILVQELSDEVVPVIRNAQHLFELRDMGLRLAQWSKMSSLGGLVGGVTHKLDNPLTSLTIGLRGHRREVGHVLEVLDAYEGLGDSILEMLEEDPELLERAPGLKGVVEQLGSIREKQRERASKGKPPVADSLEGYFAAAKRGLDSMADVVSRLRVYSRTDQFGELDEIDLKDGFEAGVDVNEVVRRTLEHLDIEGTQRRHRIEVETRFNHEAPRIRCNPRLLGDVIANLVSNAVDAVVERLGGESFEPEVRVETNVIDDGIEIKVIDNGVGIRPEHLFTVFDPFFSTKPEGKGAGLGLSIAQANVRAHGGWIKAHSDGKGATFTILLPVKRP